MSVEGLELGDKHLAIVREILNRFVREREVWAFGSRVTGHAKSFSDLDLVILGQEPVPLGTLADLADAFTESDLPYKVDLVDWATTSEKFREIILERHATL
jgi:predicted nucleotidyltransferase